MSVMDRFKVKPTNDRVLTHIPFSRNAPFKEEMNSTPIRTRDLPNKENNKAMGNHNRITQKQLKDQDNDSFSYPCEAFMNNSKTIPKRKGVSLSCVNHLDIDAEFKIEIEGEDYLYCGKCATHLSNNGFAVQRLSSSRTPKLSKEVRSPHAKKRQELNSFITSLRKLQQDYQLKGEQITSVRAGYEKERDSIAHFYSQMLDYISYIRDEHLQFIDEESERHSQICEIESSEIAETLEEMRSMREDIGYNFDKIVEEVEDESYSECMNYYQQKRGVHEHRLSQLGEETKDVVFSTPECIEEKLNSFKDFIDDVTGILTSKAELADYQ